MRGDPVTMHARGRFWIPNLLFNKKASGAAAARDVPEKRRVMRRAFMRVPRQRPLSIFLFFLCVFSGCTYALDAHSHHLSEALVQFIVWCPGFAALCTCLLLRIPLGTL